MVEPKVTIRHFLNVLTSALVISTHTLIRLALLTSGLAYTRAGRKAYR